MGFEWALPKEKQDEETEIKHAIKEYKKYNVDPENKLNMVRCNIRCNNLIVDLLKEFEIEDIAKGLVHSLGPLVINSSEEEQKQIKKILAFQIN